MGNCFGFRENRSKISISAKWLLFSWSDPSFGLSPSFSFPSMANNFPLGVEHDGFE
jgi:hypothetical protein